MWAKKSRSMVARSDRKRATYIGKQDRIGTLAAGKDVDFILIEGDPSKINNTKGNTGVTSQRSVILPPYCSIIS